MSSVNSLFDEHRGYLFLLDIQGHSVAFAPERWRARFPADGDVVALCTRWSSGRVTRGNLFDIGASAIQATSSTARRDEARRLHIGTLMWGYGRSGRGPLNYRRTLNTGRRDEVLPQVVSLLEQGDLRAAFDIFRSYPIGGFNEGFFTKFLYFAGYRHFRENGYAPAPLILDSVVRASWHEANIWPSAKGTRKFKQYESYCREAAEISTRVGCQADQVERFSFEGFAPSVVYTEELLRALARGAGDALLTALGKTTSKAVDLYR